MTLVGVVAAPFGWLQVEIRKGVDQGILASALCVLCERKRDVPLPVVGCQRTPSSAMALAAAPNLWGGGGPAADPDLRHNRSRGSVFAGPAGHVPGGNPACSRGLSEATPPDTAPARGLRQPAAGEAFVPCARGHTAMALAAAQKFRRPESGLKMLSGARIENDRDWRFGFSD